MGAESDVAERQAQEDLARAQRKADWAWLLSQPAGRRSLELLVFEFGGLQEQPHHPDPYQRSFNDGQRQVAIALDRELRLADVDKWALMHAERIERIRNAPVDSQPNKTDQ